MGSYLAQEDQRLPELCLANGTDVSCLTALLARGTDSIGLPGTGENKKKPNPQKTPNPNQRIGRVNVHKDCFSAPDSPQGHQCCVSVWGGSLEL